MISLVTVMNAEFDMSCVIRTTYLLSGDFTISPIRTEVKKTQCVCQTTHCVG